MCARDGLAMGDGLLLTSPPFCMYPGYGRPAGGAGAETPNPTRCLSIFSLRLFIYTLEKMIVLTFTFFWDDLDEEILGVCKIETCRNNSKTFYGFCST